MCRTGPLCGALGRNQFTLALRLGLRPFFSPLPRASVDSWWRVAASAAMFSGKVACPFFSSLPGHFSLLPASEAARVGSQPHTLLRERDVKTFFGGAEQRRLLCTEYRGRQRDIHRPDTRHPIVRSLPWLKLFLS